MRSTQPLLQDVNTSHFLSCASNHKCKMRIDWKIAIFLKIAPMQTFSCAAECAAKQEDRSCATVLQEVMTELIKACAPWKYLPWLGANGPVHSWLLNWLCTRVQPPLKTRSRKRPQSWLRRNGSPSNASPTLTFQKKCSEANICASNTASLQPAAQSARK